MNNIESLPALNPSSTEFLESLFAADTSVPFPLFNADGEPVAYDASLDGSLYITSRTDNGVAFLWDSIEGGTFADAQNAAIPPKYILKKEDTLIRIWPLAALADTEQADLFSEAVGMCNSAELLPVPETNGWEIAHVGPEQHHAIEAFFAVSRIYPKGAHCGAALVMRSYIASDYTQPFTYMRGVGRWDKKWKLKEPQLAFFNAELTVHTSGTKNGEAFILARMIPGQRLKKAVLATTGIGLDLDTGEDLEKLSAAVDALGCTAFLYSTHSHNCTSTDFSKDTVKTWANGREVDTDLMRAYCREVKKWNPAIVETVELLPGTFHDDPELGFALRVNHAPFPKFRLVVPYSEEFVMMDAADSHTDAMELHSKMVKVLAAKVNAVVDPATLDCSRLFYFPRHAEKRGFVSRVWGGPLLDHKTLLVADPLEILEERAESMGKRGRNSKTKEGEDLARWSVGHAAGFQVTDFIEAHAPDRIREQHPDKLIIECPNDSAHSNAGDTSDSACMAVSAGMGESPVFTISCRHGSCSGDNKLTNLDMLGLALKNWEIDREALDDPNFMAEVLDEHGEQVAPSPAAAKIDKEDKARAAYQQAIDELTEDSTAEQIDAVISQIADANLATLAHDKALDAIKAITGTTKLILKKSVKEKEAKRIKDDGGLDRTNAKDGYGGALAFAKKKGAIPKGVTYESETGEIYPVYRNALLLIGNEKWDLGYNVLTQNYGLRGDVTYPWPEHLGYALTDAIKREIRLWLLRRWGVTFSVQDIDEATMTLARRNTFNPVCDYLDAVEAQWDGISRIDSWPETYLGVQVTDENQKYVRGTGKIVLVAAVRRARDPGCKFDEMMILEGPQGGGKSTAIRTLGDAWFSDSNLGDLTKKDAAMKLRGVWLQEIGELAALNRAQVDELKEFMSQQVDRYRPPYAKAEEDFPRRCILIGTVNPGGGAYLVDLTGNRRFWPVACGEIDLDALARDRDQLWAEAAMMESRGDSIRLDPSLYDAAKAEQNARLAEDPWVSILADFLKGKTRVTTRVLLSDSDALNLAPERQTQLAMKKLKSAMARIPDWEYNPCLRVDGVRTAGYEFSPPK